MRWRRQRLTDLADVRPRVSFHVASIEFDFVLKERVRADYKFSLLDAAGNAAYELPAERGIFVAPSGGGGDYGQEGDDEGPTGKNPASCGYSDFITKDNLERRHESLIWEDSLAIRCDVGVVEVEAMAFGPKQQRSRRQRVCGGYSSDEGPVSDDEYDGGGSLGGRRRGQPPPNDKEPPAVYGSTPQIDLRHKTAMSAAAPLLSAGVTRVHDEFPRRVVAQYKFSVLDSATGAAAYELPAETGVYYTSGDGGEEEDYYHYLYGNVYYYDEEEKMEEHLIPPPVELGCGYDGFIAKAELERRREMLLKDDSLAIRCDVDVVDTEYIRRSGGHQQKERVRAEFKFSLLDAAGDAAYELPAETTVFSVAGGGEAMMGFGHAEFIAKEELERQRETLLRGDSLAIRCDVGVTVIGVVAVAPKENHHSTRHQDDDDEDDDWEGGSRRRRHQPPLDDMEYARRCLAKNRRA
nr:unnamed protein product [Digitaria exilis]